MVPHDASRSPFPSAPHALQAPCLRRNVVKEGSRKEVRVPAEPSSVSPDKSTIAPKQSLNTRVMPEKIPGIRGLAPEYADPNHGPFQNVVSLSLTHFEARKGMQSRLCALAPWRETNNDLLTGKIRVRADETEEVPSNG